MAWTCHFLEIGRAAPTPLYEAWVASPHASGSRSERVASLEDLAECEVGADDAFILPWSANDVPEHVVELICQDPRWAGQAIIVVLETIDGSIKEFLREYGLTYLVNGRELGKAVADIHKFLEQDRSATGPAGVRRFFRELAARQFAEAERRLESWRDLSEIDGYYFRGHLLKAAKNFEEAHKVLGQGLAKTRQDLRLEPKFLHLIGAVAFKRLDHGKARDFLEAAHKVSPLNLRRRSMLAQLYAEVGDLPPALEHFKGVLGRVPSYAGTHARAVEVLYALARKPEELEPLTAWLPYVPAVKLSGLAKKIDLTLVRELRQEFASALARQFVAHAAKACESDEHHAALSLLEKGEPLARQGLPGDVQTLLLARAEAALTLGDLELSISAVQAFAHHAPKAPELAGLEDRLALLRVRMQNEAAG